MTYCQPGDSFEGNERVLLDSVAREGVSSLVPCFGFTSFDV